MRIVKQEGNNVIVELTDDEYKVLTHGLTNGLSIAPAPEDLCGYCGVLVHDADVHEDWHSELAKVARAAYHADMFTRPIG